MSEFYQATRHEQGLIVIKFSIYSFCAEYFPCQINLIDINDLSSLPGWKKSANTFTNSYQSPRVANIQTSYLMYHLFSISYPSPTIQWIT